MRKKIDASLFRGIKFFLILSMFCIGTIGSIEMALRLKEYYLIFAIACVMWMSIPSVIKAGKDARFRIIDEDEEKKK